MLISIALIQVAIPFQYKVQFRMKINRLLSENHENINHHTVALGVQMSIIAYRASSTILFWHLQPIQIQGFWDLVLNGTCYDSTLKAYMQNPFKIRLFYVVLQNKPQGITIKDLVSSHYACTTKLIKLMSFILFYK